MKSEKSGKNEHDVWVRSKEHYIRGVVLNPKYVYICSDCETVYHADYPVKIYRCEKCGKDFYTLYREAQPSFYPGMVVISVEEYRKFRALP